VPDVGLACSAICASIAASIAATCSSPRAAFAQPIAVATALSAGIIYGTVILIRSA